jgi:acyl transferase domain-containing protein
LESAVDWKQNNVPRRVTKKDQPRLLLASAKSKQSLTGQIDVISKYIEDNPSLLDDVAYTLGQRRNHLNHRAFAITEGSGQISAFEKAEAKQSSMVFVFTGQGAQWPTMGKQLIAQYPQFRHDIRNMDSVLRSLKVPPAWSIEGTLLPFT